MDEDIGGPKVMKSRILAKEDPTYAIDWDSVPNGQRSPRELARTSRIPTKSPKFVRNFHICLGLHNHLSIYCTTPLFSMPNWDNGCR